MWLNRVPNVILLSIYFRQICYRSVEIIRLFYIFFGLYPKYIFSQILLNIFAIDCDEIWPKFQFFDKLKVSKCRDQIIVCPP